jgi:REP element-mobilizing transposase RayT
MKATKTPIIPDKTYHLYNHANADKNLFRCDANYAFFLRRYTDFLSAYFDTYAYCLMPNHFHLLVRVKSFDNLIVLGKNQAPDMKLETEYRRKVTNAIKNWIISYTNSYNKMFGFTGNLFVQKIRRILVDDDEYFRNLVSYIHLNPVLHEFVKKPEDWKYSSYSAYFSAKPTKIDKSTVLRYFDNLENFKYCHDLRRIEKFAKEMEF